MENPNSLTNSSQKSESSSESSVYREVEPQKTAIKGSNQQNLKKDRPRVVIEQPIQTFEETTYQNEPRFQNENGPSFTSFNQLKKELSRYKKLAEDRQISILAADTRVREAEIKLEEAVSKNKQYESDLQSLKGASQSSENGAKSTSSNGVNSTFSVFEDLLKTNSDQLKNLSDSRINLINICKRYNQCFDEAEKDFHDAIEKSSKDDPKRTLADLFKSVMEITPSDLQNKTESEKDEQKRILAIIKCLVDEKDGTGNTLSSSRSSSSNSSYSAQKDKFVLGHLENALHFIRTLEKTEGQDSPLKDAKLRDLVNKQCKEIEEFLKKNKPEKVASIFGESTSVDEQIKAFYEMADKGECDKSPVRELFALFTGSIEVNKILFDRNRVLEREYQKLRKSNKEAKGQMDSDKAEIEANDAEKTELLNRMTATLGHQPKDLKSGLEEYINLCATSTDIIKSKDSKIAKLQKALNNTQKNSKSTSDQVKSKDKQIAQLMNKLNNTQYEKETENEDLSKQLEETKKQLIENENAKMELQKTQRKLQKFQKQGESTASLTQQLQEAQEQNAVLQTQLAKITEQMDNYQASSDFTASTMSGYESHISSLKGKMNNLRKRNAELESQLHGALEDIKMRNDQLEKSYKKQIDNLNGQLEKLRSKYSEVKDINEQSKKWREEYYAQMAKMKVVQKRLEAETNEAKDAVKIAQQQSDAKLESQKIAYEAIIDDSKKKLTANTKKLAKAVDYSDKDCADIEKIIDHVIKSYDSHLIEDATKSKERLNLSKKTDLLDTINDILHHLEQQDRKLLNQEADKKQLQKDLKKATETPKSSAADQNAEWKKWIDKQYARLNEGEICPVNVEEAKRSVEKAIDGIINPATNERKYNILKTEKSIMKKIDPKTLYKMRGQKPIESIRPVVLALMFSKKIEKFSLPAELPPYKVQVDD